MVVTLLAAAAALLFVPESPVRTPARLPVVPALLLAGWLVALLLGLSEGNDWGWTSSAVLGLFARRRGPGAPSGSRSSSGCRSR